MNQLPQIPQVQKPVPTEPMYRYGYSIRNPRVVRLITEVKRDPWFKVAWMPEGPTQKKDDLFRSGHLVKYPSVWRRAAKRKNIEALSDIPQRNLEYQRMNPELEPSYFPKFNGDVELPDFEELGQAPGPTDKEATTDRDFFGVLQSSLTNIGNIMARREQEKLVAAEGQLRAMQQAQTPQFIEQIQTNWPIIAMVAIGGVLIYNFMPRRG